MKSIKIFALVSALSVTSMAIAQTVDDREQLRVGIKAGINVSNVYDEQGDNFEADPKIGFAGGGFLSIPIGRYLGLQPEVLYSQKGLTFNGSFLGADYTVQRTLGYLDIPVYVQFKPIPAITLLFGPQYCFLLHRRDKFSTGSYTTEQQEEFSNDNIRKNVFGLAGGFDLNINRFVIGARGAWDLQNNNGDGTSSNPRYKNVWFQLTGGIKF